MSGPGLSAAVRCGSGICQLSKQHRTVGGCDPRVRFLDPKLTCSVAEFCLCIRNARARAFLAAVSRSGSPKRAVMTLRGHAIYASPRLLSKISDSSFSVAFHAISVRGHAYSKARAGRNRASYAIASRPHRDRAPARGARAAPLTHTNLRTRSFKPPFAEWHRSKGGPGMPRPFPRWRLTGSHVAAFLIDCGNR